MQLKMPKLDALPIKVQIGVLVGVILALAAIAYLYYFQGALDNRASLMSEVKKLEDEVAQGKVVELQIKRFESELKQLDERLNVLRAILPDQKETPEVLRNVQQMAASSNLKILRFQPLPVVPRTFYSDWPIQIEVEGNYNALGMFFEKIGQFTRIINVDNIALRGISGKADPAKTLQANCTATTFVFKDQPVEPEKPRQ
jgi:type IV pilus assembly protein PilO